jgi:hypothetical protein
MDDAQKIAHIIEVMKQLQELELMYAENHGTDTIILSLMLALIHNTKIPEVTIIPDNRGMAQA